MEKRKIVIDNKMAVYFKNASNAFIKYADTFNEQNQHDATKIKKERHYCKVVFFNNIDRILNSINVNKKDKFDILMRILNFILEDNFVAHEYYDTYVDLHPWMDVWYFYKRNNHRRISRKNRKNKGEIFQSMARFLDTYYSDYGGTPPIKHMIGMKF